MEQTQSRLSEPALNIYSAEQKPKSFAGERFGFAEIRVYQAQSPYEATHLCVERRQGSVMALAEDSCRKSSDRNFLRLACVKPRNPRDSCDGPDDRREKAL